LAVASEFQWRRPPAHEAWVPTVRVPTPATMWWSQWDVGPDLGEWVWRFVSFADFESRVKPRGDNPSMHGGAEIWSGLCWEQ